jgi:hypothetical protein
MQKSNTTKINIKNILILFLKNKLSLHIIYKNIIANKNNI